MTSKARMRTEEMRANDVGRIVLIVIAVIVSGAASYYGQPIVHEHPQSYDMLVTVVSVLAGFLLAIITLSSEPVIREDRSWKFAELMRDSFIERLTRLRTLFVVYLLTLLSAMCASLTSDSPVSQNPDAVVIWLERLFVFLSLVSVIVSFRLPWSLSKIQIEKVDLFIERKREESRKRVPPDAVDGSDH